MKRKRLLPLLLCLAMLTACGPEKAAPSAMTESPEPEDAPAPQLTYDLTTRHHEESFSAGDGTLLAEVSLHVPELQVLRDGVIVEKAESEEEQSMLDTAAAFNAGFDGWLDVRSEEVAMAQEQYDANPDFFTGAYPAHYLEELTCTVYRAGTLISVAGVYYSDLGGPHPNSEFLGWNFDLATGTFLSVRELAADPREFAAAVADSIEAQAVENLNFDHATDFRLDAIYWEDYRSTIENWDSHAVSFDERGMTVIFSAYELAAYAAGPQEFFCPYEDLTPYFSRDGLAILGLNEA